MIVAFPHVEGSYSAEDAQVQRALAFLMIDSVRRTMPGVEIVMMTDPKTPALPADRIVRKGRGAHTDWIPWLCEFCSEVGDEVLLLDTDVIVKRDLRPLFLMDTDMVLTSRGPKEIDGRQMPFLFGVLVSKSPAIWLEIRDRVLSMPEEVDRQWWGSQVAVFEMYMEEQAGRGKWKFTTIGCDPYNYTPTGPHDLGPDKWALHYKGKKRKAWMLDVWSKQAVAA